MAEARVLELHMSEAEARMLLAWLAGLREDHGSNVLAPAARDLERALQEALKPMA